MTTTVTKRATGMPDSDNAEQNRIMTQMLTGWVINSATLASNATTVSYGSHAMVVQGVLNILATSTLAIVGTIATAATTGYGGFIFTRTATGTASNVLIPFALTVGALALPIVPTTEVAWGMTIIKCTATAFNGGTNSLADGSYTVSHYNFTGPANIALNTELFQVVPG